MTGCGEWTIVLAFKRQPAALEPRMPVPPEQFRTSLEHYIHEIESICKTRYMTDELRRIVDERIAEMKEFLKN